MKRLPLFLALFTASLVLCLSGCEKNTTPDTGKLEELKNRLEQESAEKKKENKKKKKKESLEKEKEAEEPVSDNIYAKAFADGNVENNGHAFVKVGERVYFRIYGRRALELTTIGEPGVEEVSSTVPSRLVYYDLDKQEIVDVCEVCGIGPLYVTSDGICIDSYPDGTPSTTLVNEDGNIKEDYLPGNITGVSADGRSVVVGEHDENESLFPVLYRDGTRIGAAKEEGSEQYCSAVGFAGSDLIVTMSAVTGFGESIFSYDETGKLTKLGDIEPLDMETYELSPIIEDFVSSKDKAYIAAGYRDGTANALVAWKIYELIGGKAGSLKERDSGEANEQYNYDMPKINIGSDNAPTLSSHKAGSVYLSDGYYGDIMCTNSYGKDITLRKDYVQKPREEETYAVSLSEGVCFDDGSAFCIEAGGYRDREEDVGWRWAYDLASLKYRVFRTDDAHLDDNGQPSSDIIEEIGSAGWCKGDIEYDRLVGTWETYSMNVEGEYRLASDEPGGRLLYITFYEDGSAEEFYKDSATGEVSGTRPLHRAKQSPDLEQDYAYYYETDDEDPMQVGVKYLSHNRLCIFHLYHFDGGSIGWYEVIFHKGE